MKKLTPEAIANLREGLALTYRRMGKDLGDETGAVDAATIMRWEKGDSPIPKFLYAALCYIYGTQIVDTAIKPKQAALTTKRGRK